MSLNGKEKLGREILKGEAFEKKYKEKEKKFDVKIKI